MAKGVAKGIDVELVASLVFSVVLLACAAGLLLWHLLSWRADRRRRMEPNEREFRRRQFRRRLQTTIMLALLAASLPIGHELVILGRGAGPQSWWLKAAVIFWAAVLVLLVWLVLLATADIWASKFYYGRLRDRNQLEQTRLKAQLWKLREQRQRIEPERLRKMGSGGNGDPRALRPETPETGPEEEP